MEFNKERKNIQELYTIKNRELQKRQREYKMILSKKLATRKETILQTSLQKTTEGLREEKKQIRAQIWTANGSEHMQLDRQLLKNIKCHIECQQFLSDDMQSLKTHIVNVEREICRVTKQVYDLNCKTVPDSRHQQYVLGVRKKLHLLENQLEVGVRRECDFTARNADLRTELMNLIHSKTDFNKAYAKMVEKLNSDRKYISDLIEYVMETCDGCIAAYEKIDVITKKDSRFNERTKEDVNKHFRKSDYDDQEHDFIENKTKDRPLSDLLPKEYKRREKFRRMHTKKINLYSKIIDKIMEYTDSNAVGEVIAKYQQQESVYYSYFNFSNELDYHMTLLNNTVDRLSKMIDFEKGLNRANYTEQTHYSTELEEFLEEKVEKNAEVQKVIDLNDEQLQHLLDNVELLLTMTECDVTPLQSILGDHSFVNLINLRGFLKILEKRIFDITASVYIAEREVYIDDGKVQFTVEQIDHFCEENTKIEDIVLTQQCPECAEGEAYNVDEGGEGIMVHSVRKAKEKLYEKVKQPEMQYRLHNISQCKLPRSRMLAAKRNG